jgi:hypothetical protein
VAARLDDAELRQIERLRLYVLFLFQAVGYRPGMPRRRILSDPVIAEAMQAAGECRAACVRVVTQAPINGPTYKAAQDVMEAIDGLAEILVGDRRHFHLKSHGSKFSGSHG